MSERRSGYPPAWGRHVHGGPFFWLHTDLQPAQKPHHSAAPPLSTFAISLLVLQNCKLFLLLRVKAQCFHIFITVKHGVSPVHASKMTATLRIVRPEIRR